MRKYQFINFHIKENYYLIEINRPKQLNAINKGTISELKKCFTEIRSSTKGFYGVIITGVGEKSFVAGADIVEFNELDQESAKKLSENGHELFNTIESMPIPVIALVNGYSLGGGCELALSCHLRIATENAKFSQPEINLGTIPGYGGTQRLTQIIGKGRALEMMLTAEMVDAKSALEYGLVNYILDDKEKAMEKSVSILNTVKRKSPKAIANVIKSVNNFYNKDVNGFDQEIKIFSKLCNSEDFKEGVNAFHEKRCPSFKGK
jgi:enoyl-CoA hydratase